MLIQYDIAKVLLQGPHKRICLALFGGGTAAGQLAWPNQIYPSCGKSASVLLERFRPCLKMPMHDSNPKVVFNLPADYPLSMESGSIMMESI